MPAHAQQLRSMLCQCSSYQLPSPLRSRLSQAQALDIAHHRHWHAELASGETS